MSLRMLGSAGISAADALIDVGGGASPLARALLDRGFGDLTVLDISAAGMQHARDRLGSRANQVHWLTADVLSWHPRRRYQAWHDRAVYHFLTTDEHRQQYLHTLDTATGMAPSPSSAADQPGPGRAHHPGWHHPAVHLDRAATTVLNSDSPPETLRRPRSPLRRDLSYCCFLVPANGTAGSVVDEGWCCPGYRSRRRRAGRASGLGRFVPAA
jgi:hypothetical protein